MSPSWIWSDKITNERVARVGYNHFISNKGEWNNCFSKFANRVLPPIFISTILQSGKFVNLAHYFPCDVKLRILADSRSFLANQKARNAIVGAENLLNAVMQNLDAIIGVRMMLCETSMLLFVSVWCYAKPGCYYWCPYGVMQNLDAIIRVSNYVRLNPGLQRAPPLWSGASDNLIMHVFPAERKFMQPSLQDGGRQQFCSHAFSHASWEGGQPSSRCAKFTWRIQRSLGYRCFKWAKSWIFRAARSTKCKQWWF